MAGRDQELARADSTREEKMGDQVIKRAELEEIAQGLVARGVDEATVGYIVADIGDLQEALEIVTAMYRRLVDGENPEPLLDAVESEARDHMPGHVRSLRASVGKVRRSLG